MKSAARRAVFVDRDGTITKEGEWVKHPGALELIDGAGEAVRTLHGVGFLVVMYSNQSAVARGMITESDLAAIHERLQQMLEQRGDRLDAIYSCPHHPTEGVGDYRVACECRKPKPGLLLQAQREWNIDLAQSWCIGDMARDLEAGTAVGVRGILVGTGKGKGELERMRAEHRAPESFAADITEAVARILAAPDGKQRSGQVPHQRS